MIVFVSGLPGDGKTTTSNKIKEQLDKDNISNTIIHLDELYIEFITTKYRYLKGDNIRDNIQRHYERCGGIHKEFIDYVVWTITNNLHYKYVIVEGWHLESMVYFLTKRFMLEQDIKVIITNKGGYSVFHETKVPRDLDVYKTVLQIT